MAHFTKIDENNIVQRAYTLDNKMLLNEDGLEEEQLGIDFLTTLYGVGNYIQTSYNSNIRKQYAGIGFTYDATKDKFISIQPFPSWSLDGNDDWQAPVTYPDDGKFYIWNEATTNWKEIT